LVDLVHHGTSDLIYKLYTSLPSGSDADQIVYRAIAHPAVSNPSTFARACGGNTNKFIGMSRRGIQRKTTACGGYTD
jgi:hypothetical protein